MSCDEVRDQLPDYTLGSLSEVEAAAVRRHLRGCGGCRAEAASLDEGVAMFASAAHQTQPPAELKARVMSALGEEWGESGRSVRAIRGLPLATIGVAALVAMLVGALAWGAVVQSNAGRFQRDAATYRQFLHALGGRDVRVATLAPTSGTLVEGSAVVYDSDEGKSWVLVIARAPGMTGSLTPVLLSASGDSIDLHPIAMEASGEGSDWLVTSADLTSFRTVQLVGPDGRVLAKGTAGRSG